MKPDSPALLLKLLKMTSTKMVEAVAAAFAMEPRLKEVRPILHPHVH